MSCFWKKVPDRSIWKVFDLDNVATSCKTTKLVTLKVSWSLFVVSIRRKLCREISFIRVLGKKVSFRLKLLWYNSRYQKLSNSFLRVLSALDRASIAHLIVESAQRPSITKLKKVIYFGYSSYRTSKCTPFFVRGIGICLRVLNNSLDHLRTFVAKNQYQKNIVWVTVQVRARAGVTPGIL